MIAKELEITGDMLGRSEKSQEDIPYTSQIKAYYKLDVKQGTMKVG
jgi:hypothetical protein